MNPTKSILYDKHTNHDICLFSNKALFLRACNKNLLKTLWEKEKLLVTSNFSFSHSVFYSLGKFPPFSSNLKLSFANSFNLEE